MRLAWPRFPGPTSPLLVLGATSVVYVLLAWQLFMQPSSTRQQERTVSSLTPDELTEVLDEHELSQLLSPADLATVQDGQLPDPMRLAPLARLTVDQLTPYVSREELRILNQSPLVPQTEDLEQNVFGLSFALCLAWISAMSSAIGLLEVVRATLGSPPRFPSPRAPANDQPRSIDAV